MVRRGGAGARGRASTAMTAAQDTERVAQARARFARDAFARSLGVEIAALARDRAELVLPYSPEHMNAGGVLNGGASASLLLMAGTVAAWTGVDLGAERQCGCVDVGLQYLTAASEEDVLARAEVLRRGRDLAFLDVDLRSRGGAPICRGLVTYRAADLGGRAPRLRARHEPLPRPAALTRPVEDRLFSGYVAKLGMAPLHEEPGRVRLAMPGAAELLDERGRVHAGALASIVDIAGTAASWALVGRRPDARGSTIGLQVSFPGAAAGGVVADAHVHQRAEELLFSTVHVTAEGSGQLLALGQGELPPARALSGAGRAALTPGAASSRAPDGATASCDFGNVVPCSMTVRTESLDSFHG